jgi:hypothetical protein
VPVLTGIQKRTKVLAFSGWKAIGTSAWQVKKRPSPSNKDAADTSFDPQRKIF